MKIRSGFVSNSSTSSFVIFGFKSPLENHEKYSEQLVYDDKYQVYEEIGKEIGLGYDFDCEANEYFLGLGVDGCSGEDLIDIINRVKVAGEKIGITEKPLIYHRTYWC